jgi:hypothetical protein
MSSSVNCPKDYKIIPMKNCCKCLYVRKDDDISTIWCRYLIGNRPQEAERETIEQAKPHNELRKLYARINYKRKRADRLYKTGRPRVAEEIEFEIMKLRKEIKQHEIKNQKVNPEEKTAL